MKAQRKPVILPHVDVTIGTTPAEIRDTLHAIVVAAENNAGTEESGSPQQRDQLAVAEVLTIAAWEIMSRSRQHWKGNSAGPSTATVAGSESPSSQFDKEREDITTHELKIHSLHDAQCGRWHFTRTGSASIREIERQFSLHSSIEQVLNVSEENPTGGRVPGQS
jgi:hypothetical protein